MKILIVCSYNSGRIPSFIIEQVESIRREGVEIEYFLIKGKGALGYLKNLQALKFLIEKTQPDLIHAHYGLSGLLSNFQRKVPVITTFHGSDLNNKFVRILSIIAIKLSAHSIFVSKRLAGLASVQNNFSILSCGIDLTRFIPVDKLKAREMLGLKKDGKILLFSGSFNNKIKNYNLAKQAILKTNIDLTFIELKNYTREQVNLLLNACDLALLTSFSEGSPNFIKEAMACNCPIVATDVGDIREIVGETEGTFFCGFSPEDVAEKLSKAISFNKRTGGRERIESLSLDLVAGKIMNIYEKVIREKAANN